MSVITFNLRPTIVQLRVARGAALLDVQRPGWEDEIDLSYLNLGDPDRCVLGQTYGGYRNGLQNLFKSQFSPFVVHPDAVAHGFEHDDQASYNALFYAWAMLIKERQEKTEQHMLKHLRAAGVKEPVLV